jgi:hypothetical protein
MTSTNRTCQCGKNAEVYAMDTCPGGWADYYCTGCKPQGWQITDRFTVAAKEVSA